MGYPTFWFVLVIQVSLATCASIHTVMVGDTGSFYNTPTTSALTGDTVRFIFSGFAHTVTQSSPDAPCVPLPGGFSSGINGVGMDRSGPVPMWDLIINTTDPIWFFCQAQVPSPHCEAGMVGVINPPSQEAYLSFVSAAKVATVNPTASILTVLSGSGAFATSPPTTTSSSGSPTDGTQPTTTPSDTTQTEQPTNGSRNNGAIIGGVVGGVIAVTVIFSILIYCVLRLRQRERVITPYTEASWRPNTGHFTLPGTASRTGAPESEAAGTLIPTSPPITGTSASFDAYAGNRSHSPNAGKVLTTQRSNATFISNLPASNASDSYAIATASNPVLIPQNRPGLPPMVVANPQDTFSVQSQRSQSLNTRTEQPEFDPTTLRNECVDYQTRKIAQEVVSLLEPHLRTSAATQHQPLYPQSINETNSSRPTRQLPDPVNHGRRTGAPPQYMK